MAVVAVAGAEAAVAAVAAAALDQNLDHHQPNSGITTLHAQVTNSYVLYFGGSSSDPKK